MFEKLKEDKRLLVEAPLSPVQGERFQPTGFADLGAATYQLADGTSMLLVESAQSVANRLEEAIIGPDSEIIPELEGLSYVRVQMSGASDAKTNSLIEAHRVNSPFIISDESFQEQFKEKASYAKGKPIDWRRVARAFFRYDVNSLLHGAFMANLEDGRMRMARAISGFIEARGVREVVSGGVKNNPIDPTGKVRAKDYDKDVYSNVPYQRVEYTADSIKAFFNLDLGLLRSYELGDDAFEMLVGLALFKVRRFLESGLRLRTACDLELAAEIEVTEPEGFEVPPTGALLENTQKKIRATEEMFASPPVTEITTETVSKSSDKNEE
ncbi:MAG: type I-U CRISPR-associated RAMP protein Csb1/Cas7u [Polyangia bacterium]